MSILLAADIFGNCPTHVEIYQCLNQHFNVISVCPYEDNHRNFSDEQSAYKAFIAQGGLAAYIDKIKKLTDTHKVKIAIGFSAGAAALWASQSNMTQLETGFIFYPGQIRHYLDIEPSCPWQIIFAEHETHFDQNAVINVLNKNNAV